MPKRDVLFYFGVLPGLFIQFTGAFLYFVVLKNTDGAQAVYFLTKMMIVLWPMIWFFHAKSCYAAMWKGDLKKSVLLGIFSGLAILAFVLFFYFAFQNYLEQFSSRIIAQAQSLNFLEHYVLFALFLSVAHSFIEEYFWRWFILNGLMLKVGLWPAMAMSSLAFLSHHTIVLWQFFSGYIVVLGAAGIFLAGMLWCYVYKKTGSILGSWISHFFADLAIMAAGYLMLF